MSIIKTDFSPSLLWKRLRFEKPAILYFHIPFCQKKCYFCHFYSISGSTYLDKGNYVNAIIKEMEFLNESVPLRKLKIKAVAIGGGTPMELSVFQMAKFLEGIDKYFSLPSGIEYTVEINPHDVYDRDAFIKKLGVLKRYSVNRISLGAQSFNDEVLRFNGARHNTHETRTVFGILRKNAFKNINIDLIIGLGRQTRRDWTDSLEQALGLGPDHISVFYISVPEKTRLWEMKFKDPGQFPGRAEILYRVRLSEGLLKESGFKRMSKTNYAARRDAVYMHEEYTLNKGYQVIGFGAAAVSYFNGICFRSFRDVDRYTSALNKNNILPIDRDNIFFPACNLILNMAFQDKPRLDKDA